MKKALLDRVHCSVKFGAPKNEEFKGSTGYMVTLRFKGRQITVPFYMGPALCREPHAKEVLGCLVSDAQCGEYDFEEFCSNMGYDEDSRRAERIHKACQRTAEKLERFLGEDYDEIAQALNEEGY